MNQKGRYAGEGRGRGGEETGGEATDLPHLLRLRHQQVLPGQFCKSRSTDLKVNMGRIVLALIWATMNFAVALVMRPLWGNWFLFGTSLSRLPDTKVIMRRRLTSPTSTTSAVSARGRSASVSLCKSRWTSLCTMSRL